jgi:hypothetical protein
MVTGHFVMRIDPTCTVAGMNPPKTTSIADLFLGPLEERKCSEVLEPSLVRMPVLFEAAS